MRAAGVETWSGVEDLEVVGIVEVARRLPALFRVEARILREVRARNIRAAILIDYPGFNLRLAGRLHARGVKTVQFVAPQLWAWGRWRARRMARSIDRLLVILPFEPEFFGRLGIRAEFVGNPIADALAADFAPGPGGVAELLQAARKRLGLEADPGGPVVGILPGSRGGEVSGLLPPMLDAARILRASHPRARFLLPIADTLAWEPIARQAERAGVQPVRGEGRGGGGARDVLRAADAAMVASGTAILEAGLLGTPSVLAYRFHPLSFPIVRWMSNLPPERYYIGLVNILAGEELFPELVQDRVKPEHLAREVRRLIEDDSRRAHVQRRLRDVRRSLGEPGAGGKACFERAAEVIAKLVGS